MRRANTQLLMSLSALLVVLLVSPGGVSAQQLVVEPNVNVSDLAGGGDGGRGLACGPNLVCDPTTQYCFVLFGGPPGVPPGYTCVEIPDGCPSPPTCECIPATGCKCAESGGRITVTCTAP